MNLIPVPSTGLQPRHPGGGPRQSAEAQQGITPQFVLTAMRQWWKVAVPVGLVLAVISGAVIYLLFEPVYQASARLEVKKKAPYIAFPDRYGSRAFIGTQIDLIRSPLVLGPVLERPEIAGLPELEEVEAPVEWLQQQIKVAQVGDSEYFDISYAGPGRESSAAVVNAVWEEYDKLRRKDHAERVERVIDLLEVQKTKRKQEVDRLRENVRALAKQAIGKDPYAVKPEAEIVVRPAVADLHSRLVSAEVEREILEATLKELKSRREENGTGVPTGMVQRYVEENAEVQAQEAQLSAKRASLADRKVKLVNAEKDEFYRRLEKEIQQDEKVLEELRENLRKEASAKLEKAVDDYDKEEIDRLEAQLETYKLTEKLLRDRFKAEREKLEQGGEQTVELEFAKADLDRADRVLGLIEDRVEELRTEQSAPAQVELAYAAAAPLTPVKASPYRQIILAALASLCLPFGLAVLWERMVRRVTDAQQLEEHSHLAVLGEVARLPVRTSVLRDSSSGPIGRDLGIFEESIDSLRTCLILSEPLKDMKMLAVTSSTNREGKTSVAVQLAVSIARASGEPTLLVDGDMRAPDIHRVFEVPLEPGLGDVLARQCQLKDAIVTDWSDSVHFLPAGKLFASPHKLLGNGILEALFEELRGSYRYIVVDTPPVLAAGEALVLARAADASLICAMRDVSRVDQIRKTHQRLVGAGARPVGVVLNGIPTKRYAYRYGTYGYSRG